MVTRQVVSASETAPRSPYDSKVIAFISFVCLGVLTLIIRRPARVALAGATADIPAAQGPARAIFTTTSPSSPLILRLASITRQTNDAKTLRFIVQDGRKLQARPGQFLTFSFLFDGKKVARSYSICSSPARSGYVEITPKRVRQGCGAVFLNDRDATGMTVEACGPFGHFYLDEKKHQNVVRLAAGNGITPMMAMLRYMDDFCLETTVTLLYCVRTSNDIIFHGELEELRGRLKNFQYHILLSQPHTEWPGPRGHIRREFMETTLKEIALQNFFLCGPPPFMDASRALLIDLEVKPQRIRQESFGSSALKSARPVSAAAETWWSSSLDQVRRTPSAAARPYWRRQRSMELAYLHPAGRDSVDLQNEVAGRKCANGCGRGA